MRWFLLKNPITWVALALAAFSVWLSWPFFSMRTGGDVDARSLEGLLTMFAARVVLEFAVTK